MQHIDQPLYQYYGLENEITEVPTWQRTDNTEVQKTKIKDPAE